MPSPILARADALMQRRKNPGEADDVPVLTDAIADLDDIPELDPASIEPPPEQSPNASPQTPGLREQLMRDLAYRIEQRLASELPRLIEAVVDDYLAEQALLDPAAPPRP